MTYRGPADVPYEHEVPCEHEADMPGEAWPGDDAFLNLPTLRKLGPGAIRRRWPRGERCKRCGCSLIGYHSKLHYILGDW